MVAGVVPIRVYCCGFTFTVVRCEFTVSSMCPHKFVALAFTVVFGTNNLRSSI